MATSMEVPEPQPNRTVGIALSRSLVALASVGFLTSSLLLLKVVPIFGGLFKGLGVQLPFATRVLVTGNGWIAALFVGGAVVLPIATEFLIPALRRRLIVSGSALAVSSVSAGLMVFVLYLPLFELIRKLEQTK
jgi:hypothetical protein